MILKVIRWDSSNCYHECQTEDGRTLFVDLIVDSRQLDFSGYDPDELVGKSVKCESIFPYCYIAQSVEIIEAKP